MHVQEIWIIEKLVPGGEGLARLGSGQIGFASGVVVGDHISPQRVQAKAGFVKATAWTLMRAGEGRMTPLCPVAERCGGCDWMHMTYSTQLEAKKSILLDALTRVGKVKNIDQLVDISVAPSPFRYRNRLRLQVDTQGQVGLFEKQSHRIVEINQCPVSDPVIDQTLEKISKLAAPHRQALSHCETMEIRINPDNTLPLIQLTTRKGSRRRSPDLLPGLDKDVVVVSHEDEHETHVEHRWEITQGISTYVPAFAFMQVNWAVNQQLVNHLLALADKHQIQTFLDVYCGSGNFSLPLAQRGMRGVAVEKHPRSIQAAQRAQRELQLNHVQFVAKDAKTFLTQIQRERKQFDLVLLDPPRAGAKDILELVSVLAQRFVGVCSCDPVTLARDLGELTKAHFEIVSIHVFDMFPQTHHFETFVWLKRRTSK